MTNSLFFLSTNEKKVFSHTSATPKSISQIAADSLLPRTTASEALRRLLGYGIIAQTRRKRFNAHLYFRKSEEDLLFVSEKVRSDLIGKDKSQTLSVDRESSVTLFKGKEGVRTVTRNMVSARQGTKVYTVQGRESVRPYIDIIGQKETVENHTIAKNNNLIFISVKENFEMHEIFGSDDLLHSYKGRAADKRCIDKKYFENPSSLFVYEETVTLINLHGVFAIELKDRLLATVIKKMIVHIIERSEKMHDVNK